MSKLGFRVAVDAHFASGLVQGSGRYTAGLLSGLKTLDLGNQLVVVLRKSQKDACASLGGFGYSVKPVLENWTPLNAIYGYGNALRAVNAQVIHTNYIAPVNRRVKSVVTLHDLLCVSHGKYFPMVDRLGYWAFLSATVKTATKIICVSRATYEALRCFDPRAAERAVCIYSGLDPKFAPRDPPEYAEALSRFQIHNPFILYVGRLAPIKNLCRAVEMVDRLRNSGYSDLQFVVVGEFDPKYPYPELKHILARDYPWIHRLGKVSDDDLCCLYSGSALVYFASHGEGFGFPIIEAMACAAPVLTSRGTACEEIAGGAAVLVDPTDVDEMRYEAARVLDSPALRSSLVRKGLSRSAEFRWDKCASETVAVYESALHD